MRKIALVEDDPSIREELAGLLKNEGYSVFPLECFDRVPEDLARAKPDLVLLDLGLPGADGLTLCARIRKIAPVIVVTSRNSAMDELSALSLGSDDYVTKPYNIPILLARIRAVLRRTGDTRRQLETDGLKLDLAKGTVTANYKTVELSRNELNILANLMAHPGRIVSRADLIDALWDSQIYIDDNTLSVNVTRLRSKLESLGLENAIKTRRGMGYQL